MAIEKIQGIVIDVVRHTDRNNVITLYTRTRGRISFISPAGSGKNGRMRNARLMPMSVVESDVNFRQNRDLQVLGTVTPYTVWRSIYFNPVKTSIILFLSEFLNRYLRETSPDTATWDFIYSAIRILDSIETGLSNFHIWFLISFLDFAGIAPDMSDYDDGDWLDMRSGITMTEAPLHRDTLDQKETAFLNILSRISIENMSHFRFNGKERRILLEKILYYYSIHFPGMANMRSLDVLSNVFEG